MQVHFSYQHGSSSPQWDEIIETHVRKLDQLLVRFSPDLVHLHGVVEFGSPKQGTLCSLNLWLPTAQLHAREQGKDLGAVLRTTFEHIEEQVKKHKEVLRREGEWKRKRQRGGLETEKSQAGEFRLLDRQQLREYLDQVMPQLKRFVSREVRYQGMGGTGKPVELQDEEIINEVVARALENYKSFIDDAAPYHLLLKEVIHALNGASSNSPAPVAGKKSEPARKIPPGPPADPVELYLALLPQKRRQVYVLHALEGFSFEEAAQVLGQLPSEVEEAFHGVQKAIAKTLQENHPASG